VRASIFDAEMFSRLGFSGQGTTADPMTVRHLEIPTTGAAPSLLPLVSFIRPTEAKFKAQLAFLNEYADLRPDRAAEILAQVETPVAFLSSIAYLRPDRSRHTVELLAAAFRLARFVEMRVKHALACRRPNEYSPQVQPMILTPSHGSLPSGHATEAFTMALVLWRVMVAGANPAYNDPSYGVQLLRQAARIAINRTVAGVHFPVDSVAGAVLGLTLGQYLVNRASGATNYRAVRFDGGSYPNLEDFNFSTFYDVASTSPAIIFGPYVTDLAQQTISTVGAQNPLKWLWDEAVLEWA
jgi:membrane-associated phospholipid phosphatase